MEHNKINFYIAEVISTVDAMDGGRIKVFIPGVDSQQDKDNISKIPYVLPMLPRLLQVPPQVGEAVLVFTQENDSTSDRFYIGPLISQTIYKDYCPYSVSMDMIGSGEQKYVKPSPSMDPENNGTLPDRYDVALQGRFGTDLLLKENEVQMRCGFQLPSYYLSKHQHFNRKNPAYIQMKYASWIGKRNIEYNSVINIVADRINLVSHNSDFKLTEPSRLITDEEIGNIVEKSHPLVYGDELTNFLQVLINIFENHTHAFAGLPPIIISTDEEKLHPEWNNMLSDTVTTT